MMRFNKMRRLIHSAAIVAAAAVLSFAGCTTSDDTLGLGFLPENQEMLTGTMRLGSAQRLIQTRLFQTDSMQTSNVGFGYFGAQRNDTTGLTKSGFVSQFLNYYRIDSGYFGYRPIFDSAQIVLSITKYGRDTITPQTFNVYELKSTPFVTGDTTVRYANFDPAPYIDSEPIFTFTFPNEYSTGPASVAVTMKPTERGREFAKRLMISDGTHNLDPQVGYSVYKNDTMFINAFKGLYITPAAEKTMAASSGNIYGTDLTASGFRIYGRSRVQSDPSLIKDTVGAIYFFKHADFTHKNQSVNIINHDYQGSLININDAKESNPNRPLSTSIVVSGMGGVISELTFDKEFFEAIDKEIADINTDMNMRFNSLGMNRALMTIYFTGSDYDYTNIIPSIRLSELMGSSIQRLGTYTNIKKVKAITDYDFYTEKSYGVTLAYGGYINRSQSCYVLDISGYLQQLWNEYCAAKKLANGGPVDLSLIKNRSIYLGPDAYSLFTNSFAVVQGMYDQSNNAPVKIDITYTLLREEEKKK